MEGLQCEIDALVSRLRILLREERETEGAATARARFEHRVEIVDKALQSFDRRVKGFEERVDLLERILCPPEEPPPGVAFGPEPKRRRGRPKKQSIIIMPDGGECAEPSLELVQAKPVKDPLAPNVTWGPIGHTTEPTS
jgi:hypothetical protein